MAFIKEKERKSLISKINHSYGFRKVLISIEIAALIGFMIVVFLMAGNVIKVEANTDAAKVWGIVLVVWGSVLIVLGIIALILTLTLKSPKTVKKEIDKLQSSALSGKRVFKTSTSQETNRSRTTVKEEKK